MQTSRDSFESDHIRTKSRDVRLNSLKSVVFLLAVCTVVGANILEVFLGVRTVVGENILEGFLAVRTMVGVNILGVR